MMRQIPTLSDAELARRLPRGFTWEHVNSFMTDFYSPAGNRILRIVYARNRKLALFVEAR